MVNPWSCFHIKKVVNPFEAEKRPFEVLFQPFGLFLHLDQDFADLAQVGRWLVQRGACPNWEPCRSG